MASRWITVRRPFDFRWPSGAITAFTPADLGDHLVKAELADFAVGKGHATEGKVDGSSRSRKGAAKKRPSTSRRKGKSAGETADSRPDNRVAEPDMADADRPAGGVALDPDSEQR
jgi:hypothetical protein